MLSRNWRWLVAFAVPLTLLVGGPRLYQLGLAASEEPINLEAVPRELDGWRGTDRPVSAAQLAQLEREATLLRTYKNEAGKELSIAVVYSSRWKGLHSAESCLTGAGWAIVRQYPVTLHPPGEASPAAATVVETKGKGGLEMIELYLFVNKRGTTANWSDQLWMLIKSRGKGEMACHFILNQYVRPEDTKEAVVENLRQFAERLLPFVRRSLGA